MIATIAEILTAVFAVIGLYELVSQICNYFVRRKNASPSFQTQVRIVLDEKNCHHSEFVLRSLLSACDNGLLKDAQIVVIDNGMDKESKKVCSIFEDAVARVHIEEKNPDITENTAKNS